MILNGILGALAVLSFLLTLWQCLVARRFPLHQRSADPRVGAKGSDSQSDAPSRSPARQPPVTLLKPLIGCDAHTEACLRSWFAQAYAGEIQILFGIADASDPAGGLVEKLLAEFPQCDARLIVCPERLGANAKVSKLTQLEPHAKNDLLVVSDADVLAPRDLLANLIGPFAEAPLAADVSRRTLNLPAESTDARRRPAAVGLVSCFYQFANPTTLAMRWEAIGTNADFWSQVLQSRSLKPLDFALGAVMATRRKHLAEIGGFRALVDCLADDYQLGHRLAKLGRSIVLCPVVVECWSATPNWRQAWRHQLRWARTIRVCQPLPYFFSIVSNATLWPLLWLLAQPSFVVLVLVLTFLVARLFAAHLLQAQLTRTTRSAEWWLVPFKDLTQVALWAGAMLGNRITWRGERFRLRRDGTLAKL